MSCIGILLLLAETLLAGPGLQERIDAVLESSAARRRAFWGIQIVNLETGETLYEKGQDQFFVPASNAKLFSTALALVRLGPDYRLETVVTADQRPDPSGRLAGDLRIVGGGDPTLSAREIPYRKGPITGDPLRAIEELADQVIASGVRRIGGDVVGDDTAYVWEPHPEGWTQDDALWEYGAPVSALTVNDNSIYLTVRPAKHAGEPARLFLWPPLEYYLIDNRVNTVPSGERNISMKRTPGSRQLRLGGTIPLRDRGKSYLLAIDKPALFAANALLDALGRRGVAVSGRAVARHRFADEVPDRKSGASSPSPTREVVLARRTSPPLVEILRIINKESQNLHAELMLREVARTRRNIGSREAGLEELKDFLTEAGISEKEHNLEDASGLSKGNLVTPAAVIKLLQYMHQSEHRDAWLSLLPIGGIDGTLSSRFRNRAAARRIWAKTGTMSHVSALSGYARTRPGDLLAFSILVNNYNASASAIRRVIDTICTLMIQ
jgi:D-alanyl-D-alanine carboxypeptidase/D-alanyl-D-alanine-endopeptidase (penicillin-binding protein 4)